MRKLFLILFLFFFAALSAVAENAGAATTYYYCAPGGTGAGTSWADANGDPFYYLNNTVAADTFLYLRGGGTYTAQGTTTYKASGAVTTPIRVIGVLSTTTNTGANIVAADYAYTTNRPDINMNTYVWTTLNYAQMRNVNFYNNPSATATTLITAGTYNYFVNCHFDHRSTAAVKYAMYASDTTNFVNCEFQSANGYAVGLTGSSSAIVNCYIHNSLIGASLNNVILLIYNSIIYSCTTGITSGGGRSVTILNNTIYGGTTGIALTTTYQSSFINNIVSQSTTGATMTAGNNQTNIWANNLFNCTTNTSNITLDSSNLALAVGTQCLNSPATGDFTLTYAAARNAGLMPDANQGLTGTGFKWNIGVDQNDTAVAGGGTTTTTTKTIQFHRD